MKEIRIEKITLNLGVGQPGEKLDKAMKLLQNITGLKPIQTKTMKRIPTWGVRPNLPIGCKVTVRGKDAADLLKRLLKGADNKINASKFDKYGNFSFGLDEYINIPGVEYDVDIGILGLDVAVTLERKGFRIRRRRLKAVKIPTRNRITKDEAINFMKEKFGISMEE